MVYGDERSRRFVFREVFLARCLELFDVRIRSKQHHRLAEARICALSYHERHADKRLQMGFYLLYLQFYATAAHHIVASAAYAEVSAVGSYLRDVVGSERSGAYSRSVYHKTAVGVETNVDAFKRFVPVRLPLRR